MLSLLPSRPYGVSEPTDGPTDGPADVDISPPSYCHGVHLNADSKAATCSLYMCLYFVGGSESKMPGVCGADPTADCESCPGSRPKGVIGGNLGGSTTWSGVLLADDTIEAVEARVAPCVAATFTDPGEELRTGEADEIDIAAAAEAPIADVIATAGGGNGGGGNRR